MKYLEKKHYKIKIINKEDKNIKKP